MSGLRKLRKIKPVTLGLKDVARPDPEFEFRVRVEMQIAAKRACEVLGRPVPEKYQRVIRRRSLTRSTNLVRARTTKKCSGCGCDLKVFNKSCRTCYGRRKSYNDWLSRRQSQIAA